MKIFWAWQSDLPGKVSRHFVRDCLETAIKELRADLELEVPERDDLHLDHDRKGVPGSPDLADLILKKIQASSAVVADVTTVGQKGNGEPVQNPNVMIELGYALAQLGSERLIMVFNSAFGSREDLPFDLRHKAGPIFYDLPEEATRKARKEAEGAFIGSLRSALRDCVVAAGQSVTLAAEPGTRVVEERSHYPWSSGAGVGSAEELQDLLSALPDSQAELLGSLVTRPQLLSGSSSDVRVLVDAGLIDAVFTASPDESLQVYRLPQILTSAVAEETDRRAGERVTELLERRGREMRIAFSPFIEALDPESSTYFSRWPSVEYTLQSMLGTYEDLGRLGLVSVSEKEFGIVSVEISDRYLKHIERHLNSGSPLAQTELTFPKDETNFGWASERMMPRATEVATRDGAFRLELWLGDLEAVLSPARFQEVSQALGAGLPLVAAVRVSNLWDQPLEVSVWTSTERHPIRHSGIGWSGAVWSVGAHTDVTISPGEPQSFVLASAAYYDGPGGVEQVWAEVRRLDDIRDGRMIEASSVFTGLLGTPVRFAIRFLASSGIEEWYLAELSFEVPSRLKQLAED